MCNPTPLNTIGIYNVTPTEGAWMTAMAPGYWDLTGNTLMVGTPGGGIYTTTNSGANWTSNVVPINAQGVWQNGGPYDPVIYALQWDTLPTSNNIYALTPDQLFKASDWGPTNATPHWKSVSGFVTAPNSLETIAAGKGLQGPAIPWVNPIIQMTLPTGMQAPGHPNGERVLLWATSAGGLFYLTNDDGTGPHQIFPFPGGNSNPLNLIQSIATETSGSPQNAYIYIASMGQDPNNPPSKAPLYRAQWNPGTDSPAAQWLPFTNGLPAQSFSNTGDFLLTQYNGGTIAMDLVGSTYYHPDNANAWQTAALGVHRGEPEARTLVSPGSTFGEVFVDDPQQSLGFEFYNTNVPMNNILHAWQRFTGTGQGADSVSIVPSNALNSLWLGFGSNYEDPNTNAATGAIVRVSPWNDNQAPLAANSVALRPPAVSNTTFFTAVPTKNVAGQTRRYFTGAEEQAHFNCSDVGIAAAWNSYHHGGADLSAFAVSPGDWSTGYLLTEGGGGFVQRYTALNTNPTCNQLPNDGISGFFAELDYRGQNLLAVDPTTSANLYLVNIANIMVSNNANAPVAANVTWTASTNLPNNLAAISVYADAAGDVIAGTLGGGAYIALGARTLAPANWVWTFLGPTGLATLPQGVYSEAITPLGTYYLGTTQGLYRSADHGTTWNEVSGLVEYTAHRIAVDPFCAQHVAVAFGTKEGRGGGISRSTYGLPFMSRDDGHTWGVVLAPGRQPYPFDSDWVDVQFDPVDGSKLNLASYGSVEIQIDWGAKLACP